MIVPLETMANYGINLRFNCSFLRIVSGTNLMAQWQRGDLVELDGVLAVVTSIAGDPGVPDDHIAVWFGDPRCKRKSEGGTGGASPEIWTVPEEYFVAAAPPVFKH